MNLGNERKSVRFSHSVMSNSLWPHGLQHARLPCPSPTPSDQTHVHWVSDVIQPSHPLLSFSPPVQSFPASGSFPMSQFFASGGQNIGVQASTSVFSNEYTELISFRIDWLDLFAVQGTLRSLLQHHSSKESILRCSTFFRVQRSHPYMTTGKTIVWLDRPLLAK